MVPLRLLFRYNLHLREPFKYVFYVDDIDEDSVVTIQDPAVLTNGEWRDWVKGAGKK